MAVNLKNPTKKYENLLKKSKTAVAAGVKPSSSDLSAQANLISARNTAETAESAKIKTEWYGDEAAGETKKSWLGRLLHAAQAPTAAVAGAVEWAAGKGTKKELLPNIKANVEEEGNFGDILRGYGLSNTVAMPVGLALDIASDPINWITAGTSALVPRVATGIVKGAAKGTMIEGASTALKSGLLSKAESVVKAVPGLSSKAWNTEVMTKEMMGETNKLYKGIRNLSAKSAKASKEYNKIIDKDIMEEIAKESFFKRTASFLDDNLRKTPAGRKIAGIFEYSPTKWFQAQKVIEGVKTAENMGVKDAWRYVEGVNIPEGLKLEDQIKAAAEMLDNKYILRAANSREIAYRLQGEAINAKIFKDGLSQLEARKAAVRDIFGSDGNLQKYDAVIEKTINSKYGLKFLENYAVFTGLFKNAKIGGNILTAGTNAVVGNLTMTALAGVDVLSSGLYHSMRNALKLVTTNDWQKFNELVFRDEWKPVLKQNAELFRKIYGVDANLLLKGKAYLDEVFAETSRVMMKNGSMEEYNQTMAKIREAYDDTIAKKFAEKSGEQAATSLAQARSSIAAGQEGTFITSEILRGPYGDFVDRVKKMADDGKFGAKAVHWYLTKPMDTYGKIDQVYKLGLTMHLSNNGITEKELLKLSKAFDIDKSSVRYMADMNVYRLMPEKAMEIASQVYMNYAAMPAFVQIMRSLPVMGSPFFSFAYGMTSLAGKAALTNPSIVNKVNFALKEFSGGKTPLEKQALSEKGGEFYKQPGMIKLSPFSFFNENPIYLNMENMIPYYTLNVFQPSARSYKEKVGNTVASVIDKMPFLKTPDGQIMFDYLIQPLILKETPKNSFNQQVWSKSAGAGEKIGRVASAAAETVVPPLAGLTGIVGGSMVDSELGQKITSYVPSYSYRKLANAVQGKNATGIKTKEGASAKTLRALGAISGVPTYQLNLKYVRGKQK